MKNKLIHILILLSLMLGACSTNPASEETIIIEEAVPATDAPVAVEVDDPAPTTETAASTEEDEISRAANWSEETHSKEADLNYDIVFPQDEVNRLDISISPENWAMMQADMTSLYGEFGSTSGGQREEMPGAPAQGGMDGRPAQGGMDEAPAQGGMGGRPAQGGMGEAPAQGDVGERGNRAEGGMNLLEGEDSNPIWVTGTVEFEGNSWENVGVRFKGNSSLSSSWRIGDYKLPLKLDFDEFEDTYPEIDDQRFYGFKQLSLSSNFNDNSLLREKVAADVFRESGVPAAQTAFYEVYVDYGQGSTYLGLYTMVEVVDDTLIKTQFDDDSGNVYKPSGTGATFADGSFSEESFDKETNKDEADYSDILALYDALHSETRTSNPESWRAELESLFDVDGFLHYLAINNTIQNWDTYGNMSHNYYLYNNPETGLLTWIPWDNNEAFGEGKKQGTLSMSMNEVNQIWPLIRYLIDDPIYNEIYTNYLSETVTGAFNPDKMAVTYQELATLIAPYASADVGESAFNSAVQQMINHAYERAEVVNSFLGK